MIVHLIDGTFELFRHFYAVPSAKDRGGMEVGAVRGVVASIRGLVNGGATHVGVATDHVIESFRNDLYPGYKTGEGIEPALWAQFPLLEEALTAYGVRVWPMVEFEADDALGAAAVKAAADPRVTQVRICTLFKRIGCAAQPVMKLAWSPSSACRPRPFPITSRSSVIHPMAIPVCKAGARSRQRSSSRSTATSRTSRTMAPRGA